MQSEVSQKEKDKYHILAHTHTHTHMYICPRKMIQKNNLFARQEYRRRRREQTCEGRRGWDKLKGNIETYTPPHIKQTASGKFLSI